MLVCPQMYPMYCLISSLLSLYFGIYSFHPCIILGSGSCGICVITECVVIIIIIIVWLIIICYHSGHTET